MDKDIYCSIIYHSSQGKQLNRGVSKLWCIFTMTLYAVVKTVSGSVSAHVKNFSGDIAEWKGSL